MKLRILLLPFFVFLFCVGTYFTYTRYFVAAGGKIERESAQVVNSLSDYLATLCYEEQEELVEYLKAFPHSSYKVYKVKKLGSFYAEEMADAIKDWVRKGVPWEKDIAKLLKRYSKPGTVVVDIGAHIGLHTRTMARSVGSAGTVYAFEPQKKLYRELAMNMRLNRVKNVKGYRIALGNDNKIIYASPLAPGNEGGTGLDGGGDAVQLMKLDDFHLTNVSLIKMDVEGFEDDALEGARKTILKNKPVIIIEIMGGYDYNTASKEIRERVDVTKAKLRAFGYDVTPVSVHDYLAIPK